MEIGSEPEVQVTQKKISLRKSLPKISSIQELDEEMLIRDPFGLSIEWSSLKDLTPKAIEEQYSLMKKILNGPVQRLTTNMAWNLIKWEKRVLLPPDVAETMATEKHESMERFEKCT